MVSQETHPLVNPEMPRSIRVMLINMEGEGDLSLHEPIGIESVASRLLRDMPGTPVVLYDVQPELVRNGKVDTDRLAERIRQFADESSEPFILGIGVPIYAWEYTKSLLIKLEQQPTKSPMSVVLGNAIPTYTNPEILKKEFPYAHLVVGEGEEAFVHMAKTLAGGNEIQDWPTFVPPDLEDYVRPVRWLTQEIVDLGGSVKVEASRGCDWGACTFCSRCLRAGKDYRTVPEQTVVAEMDSLLDTFNITRFELTDEEAFGDTEATARLVSALKSADLPRVPFVASLRVDTLIHLHETGLLSELKDVGLDKVFLGVEGGSDAYLKQLAKGQKVEEVKKAVELTLGHGIDLEIGFITFSWRMTIDMLRENIEFLSSGYAKYTSELFNELAVRAGTLDETLVRRFAGKGLLGRYNPDEKFSVNRSYYLDVPFLDSKVSEVYRKAKEFAEADAPLYYALKSLVRAKTLPPEMQREAIDLYLEMKAVHLHHLRQITGLDAGNDATERLKGVVDKIYALMSKYQRGNMTDIVLREAESFLKHDREKSQPRGDTHVGALVVCKDEQDRILLVRARDEEDWGFPGGGVMEGEDLLEGAKRETIEELGVSNVVIEGELPVLTFQNYRHSVLGIRPTLRLHHYIASLRGPIDIMHADHEIADLLWLPQEEILAKKVKVKENVAAVVAYMNTGVLPEESGVTIAA